MKNALLAAVVVGIASAAASATQYQWDWNGNPVQNPGGGTVSAIASTFDTSSKRFTWDVSYSDGASRDTDGFWLVVNDGPNPKNHDRELAIMYFDATNLAAPKVSIFRYNGANNANSFSSPGDLLAYSGNAGSGITATASQSGAARSFHLSVDAASINSRFSAANGFPDWKGIQFDDKIGMWFHSLAGAQFSYANGCLVGLSGQQGWIDGENITTRVIPAPGSVALLATGGLLAVRRRRK